MPRGAVAGRRLLALRCADGRRHIQPNWTNANSPMGGYPGSGACVMIVGTAGRGRGRGEMLRQLRAALSASFAHFGTSLAAHPWVVALLLLLFAVKVGANVALGAGLLRMLITQLIGFLFYGAAVLVIDTVSGLCLDGIRDASVPQTAWVERRPAGTAVLAALWVFWLCQIIHRLQQAGGLPGEPMLNGLPGWRLLEGWLAEAGAVLAEALPIWREEQATQILGGLLLQVVLPMLVLRLLGYRWRDFALTCRGWQAAAPILLLYLVAFLSGGVTGSSLALLGYAILYPGLTEEFFYRGLLQRSLSAWMRSGHALAVSAVLFGLLHLPSLLAGPYGGSRPLVLSQLSSLVLYGLFMGYGYRRSGGLLPWMLIHGLSDAVQL